MMALGTHQAALKAWVEGVLAVPVYWYGEQFSWTGKTRVRLKLSGMRGRGVDQVTFEQQTGEPAGADMSPRITGPREMTLNILVESRDHTATGRAAYYLERLRTSLQLPRVKAAFTAAGLAFASAGGVLDLDQVVQNRQESQASLDILLNASVDVTYTDSEDADSYVETFGIAAALDDSGWDETEFGNT